MNAAPHPHPLRVLLLLTTLVSVCTIPLFAAPATRGIRAIPFNPRSGTSDHMTFTAIPAAESGLVVANPYDDPAMWGERYTEFQGGAIGSGIAVGDIDADGLVDIYVANKTRPNQLFRQVSPFKFVDITEAAGVAGPATANGAGWKTGVTMADVDGDGDLDLYVCRFRAPNLLFLNDGKGHFTEAAAKAGIDLVSGSVVGAFEDYDRDGQLDLFVVTNVQDAAQQPDGEPDYLFHNRGDGTFEQVSAKAGISPERARGHSAAWIDENGDGWPDLYIANDFSQPDHLYRNNGDGTFTDVIATAVPHTPWFSMGSDFGDINNDGLLDFIVADMAGTTHFKSKVTMGDMGGLVNHMDTLVTPQYMKNAVFLNSGTDRFLEISKMAGLGSSDWTWSLRFEDLDNDGWLDLHITNGMVRSFIDSDLVNRAKKMQTQAEVIALMKNSPPLRETHLALRNDHNLHFTKVQKDWGLDHTGVSFGSAFADFDNDGDLDLVYVNYDDTVSLYRNDCPTGNSIIVELHGRTSNPYGVGAQVIAHSGEGIQIRKLTVARGALSSSEPVVHFGLGGCPRIAGLEVRWPSGHVQRFENLKVNVLYIITEPEGPATPEPAVSSRPADHGVFSDHARELGIDYVNKERVFDDMKRQSLLPNRMNTLGGGLAWGDANGDGAPDLFFAGAAGNASALYLNDGHGHFARSPVAQPWDQPGEVEAMSPLFLDVDGDGDADLFVSSGSVESDKGSDNYRSRLYLNDGHGVFTAAPADRLALRPTSSSIATAADFDHDGRLDVFVGGRVVPGEYPTAPESLLLATRQGVLTDVTDEVCPALRKIGMVTAALWTDVDNDGWIDLLVTGEWMSVRLLHNDHGKLVDATPGSGFDSQIGWWNSITGMDINHDGNIEYLVGNVGLNTKYHASKERPVSLYYADIEGGGDCQVIEAEYEGDKLYPVRGRSCSSRAMPSLKEKFPTFHAFGGALLPEIYPTEKLSQGLKLEANQLASGIFSRDASGRFVFRELPRLAQTSPIFGLAALDVTGDSSVDLVVVQNFAGPQVETGRFDGGLGLLLTGDGHGNFNPATAQESGIAISGDARGLAVCDVNQDGWPDLVVTRVNENALVYLNRGIRDAHSFAIKLAGPAGNPDGIGARIKVNFHNDKAEIAELYAGSGYLSQSEPLAFFGYETGLEPLSIDVTWPDGTRTSHPFVASQPHLVLRQKR